VPVAQRRASFLLSDWVPGSNPGRRTKLGKYRIMWQDLVNAAFQVIGSIAVWLNVVALYKDKKVKGVNVGSFLCFTLWGYWNLYYYPHLGQTASFIGGISIAIANTVWTILVIQYKQR